MHTRQLPSWLWTTLALALGLILRLWFIAHYPRIAGDTLVYGAIAKNWMLHGIYGWVVNAGGPQPTLIRLPGYPLFLVACFRLFGVEHYTAVLYVQTVIDLLACFLLASLARRIFGPHARLAALWLSALCPFTASYVAAPLTETLTLACVVLAFYALHRWQAAGAAFNRWLWVIALALAYSILLRPEQGLLAAAVLPAMLWIALGAKSWGKNDRVPHPFSASTRKGGITKLLPVFTAAICTLLPLIPWTIRNHRTFHVVQPLAPRYATDPGEFIPLGFQRWYRTWAIDFASTEDVYWNYDGAPIPLGDLPTRAFDSPDQYARTATLLASYNQTTTATPELDARFNTIAAERTTAYPLRTRIGLPMARLLNMALRPRVEMFATPLEWWKYSEHPQQTLFAAAYATLNLAYFALAAYGLILWLTRDRPKAPIVWSMLATILLRAALLLTLDNSEPRYTLEFFPILFLFAAIPFATRHQSGCLTSRL